MPQLANWEKKAYFAYHAAVYKEDLSLGMEVIKRSPRWSIIMGYYAMHTLGKLYLGEVHNIKITGDDERPHRLVVTEIGRVLRDTNEHDKVLKLLEDANETFEKIQHPRQVAALLEHARRARGDAQYYSRPESTADVEVEQAQEFYDKIVMVFVELMEKMRDAS